METQTRFDLNAAIQNWRQELAGQPNLTAETRRELETHVRDTMAELQRRGLNDEESFWLARRRVGQPNELGEEFGKADPFQARREGVLGIAVAFFALYLWQDLADLLRLAIFPQYVMKFGVSAVIRALFYLPVAWLAVFVAQGHATKAFMAWRSIIRSRGRFLVVACFSLLAIKTLLVALSLATIPAGTKRVWPLGLGSELLLILSTLLWPAALIAIIVWLVPMKESRTYKRG
jgi:hypothetical protein